ncbi:LamG-like jellyroll fold domain-containing protein [Dickeya dadantii subsp. dieffenbachiae]|uniref:LamG-like jellyroll fold domain-containing protein n=1 Tax=Dickeya dadantii TaxID=204038 RepID=UPI0003AA46DC|nr:LamG-like jellyroll fold domain-containing protein [Dickeya dadantii]
MTLSGNVCIVYIDGIEVGRNEAFTLAPYQLGAAASAYLGRSQYARDATIKGRYDYFRILSGALSSVDIAALAKK